MISVSAFLKSSAYIHTLQDSCMYSLYYYHGIEHSLVPYYIMHCSTYKEYVYGYIVRGCIYFYSIQDFKNQDIKNPT